MTYQAEVGDRSLELEVRLEGDRAEVTIAGRTPHLDLVPLSATTFSLLIDGQSHYLSIQPDRKDLLVNLRQRTYRVRLRSKLDLTIERLGMQGGGRDSDGQVVAPIPGVITSVAVAEGDEVDKGDQLLVLEAMKMENELLAPFQGTVSTLYVAPGEAVIKGARLVDLKSR